MNILQIANLNTHGIMFFSFSFKEKMRSIAEFFEKEKVDIICFQEVFFWPHLFLLRKLLSNYPYYAYSPAFHGPKGGLVVFSRKSITGTKYESFSKKGYLFNISLIDIIFQKGFLQIVLKDWIILNTHLTASFLSDWKFENIYTAIQNSQIKQIAHDIKKVDKPTIVVGDFNFPDNSDLYKKFLKYSEARDIFSSNQRSTTAFSSFPYKEKKLRIDYQFVKSKNSVKIVSPRRIFDKKIIISNKPTYVSDHFGLLSTVEVL